jgi:hypothetical protein
MSDVSSWLRRSNAITDWNARKQEEENGGKHRIYKKAICTTHEKSTKSDGIGEQMVNVDVYIIV